jgi:hypothetical protein
MRILGYRKAWAGLEFAVGVWLIILGGILVSYGFWWGTALIAAAALPLGAAYWLLRGVQSKMQSAEGEVEA